MKIAIASDHGGFAFKTLAIDYLRGLGYQVYDCGCKNGESCDYPDFAKRALKRVCNGKADRAILICTNGIGMCILANKYPHIYAALVYNQKTAKMTRQHHDSNVLCLGAGMFSAKRLLKFIDIWLTTEFSQGKRHIRRLKKIEKQDNLLRDFALFC